MGSLEADFSLQSFDSSIKPVIKIFHILDCITRKTVPTCHLFRKGHEIVYFQWFYVCTHEDFAIFVEDERVLLQRLYKHLDVVLIVTLRCFLLGDVLRALQSISECSHIDLDSKLVVIRKPTCRSHLHFCFNEIFILKFCASLTLLGF